VAKPDFVEILRALAGGGVDFVIVGGVAAVLQSAPVSTFDLDVVHSREPDNVKRLMAALRTLDACYRLQPEKRLRPDASHLRSAGHQLLATRYGDLDVLGAIGNGRGYEQLVADSVEMKVAEGVSVRVLDLPTLIAVKEEAAREKDLAVLPILRSALEEQNRRK